MTFSCHRTAAAHPVSPTTNQPIGNETAGNESGKQETAGNESEKKSEKTVVKETVGNKAA